MLILQRRTQRPGEILILDLCLQILCTPRLPSACKSTTAHAPPSRTIPDLRPRLLAEHCARALLRSRETWEAKNGADVSASLRPPKESPQP